MRRRRPVRWGRLIARLHASRSRSAWAAACWVFEDGTFLCGRRTWRRTGASHQTEWFCPRSGRDDSAEQLADTNCPSATTVHHPQMWGTVAFLHMPVKQFPNVQLPIVIVTQSGAAPTDMGARYPADRCRRDQG